MFGIAKIQEDQALTREPNILVSPRIVTVIDCRFSYFMRTEFTEETIIDFLVQALLDLGPLRSPPHPGLPSTALAAPLMSVVNNEDVMNTSVIGWLEDSRPRALFLKPAPRPPLRFCLAAFRAVDFHASAFVNTRDPNAGPILQRLGLKPGEVSAFAKTGILCYCVVSL